MPMRRLVFKGGYGEHGRSCFLVQYQASGRCYMVDCGILDEDPDPYPEVSREELERVDYLFLTHCHKDHTGAVPLFLKKGFRGTVVASEMTFKLDPIAWESAVRLPAGGGIRKIRLGELEIQYGRSGHCPGGLWFWIGDSLGSCFFSGDYQGDPLLYVCDRAVNIQADLAVADCAHDGTDACAAALRRDLQDQTRRLMAEGHPVLFPVPKYGRGLEMLLMLKRDFPEAALRVDQEFISCSRKMLKEDCWYQEDAGREIRAILEELEQSAGVVHPEEHRAEAFDLLLLADTHLAKTANQSLVREAVERNGRLIITGRIKAVGLPAKLYREEKAVKCLYPHHQSRGDLLEMISQNQFQTVYPYHNHKKEVYLGL